MADLAYDHATDGRECHATRKRKGIHPHDHHQRPLDRRPGRQPARAFVLAAALRAALELAAERGAQTELLDLNALDLPLFRPDQPINAYPAAHHGSIVRIIDACRRADALLWSSPTYHGTVSGAFKNALDFLELLRDEEPPYLQGKAVGLIAVSDTTTFAAMRRQRP